MATRKQGGDRGGNRGRSDRNNNPEGRNQYSGVVNSARENPLTAAAAIGGAVAAGIFLWSRRNQISDQIGSLSDQLNEWRDGLGSDSDFSTDGSASTGGFIASSSPRRGGRRSQAELSEEALTLKETGKTA